MKRKNTALQIAEHFGCDYAELKDYRYQPTRFDRAVYCGMDGNNMWAAGPRAPKHREGNQGVWVQVPSNWKGNPPLWRGSQSGADES